MLHEKIGNFYFFYKTKQGNWRKLCSSGVWLIIAHIRTHIDNGFNKEKQTNRQTTKTGQLKYLILHFMLFLQTMADDDTELDIRWKSK